MQKNVSGQKAQLFFFDATTGLPKTGDAANLTAYISKDGGAVTVLGDTTATEMDATNAKGWYQFDLTQAETNGDELLLTGKSSTANVTTGGRMFSTVPASFTSFVTPTGAAVNATQFAGQTITAAAGVTLPSSVASPTNITAATGVVLSAAGVQAIWDALASALTTVGSIGKLIVDNLNAQISSRMATYTQPTGFLAATFPGTVASTTNITAASGVSIAAGGIGSGAHAAAELNAIADALLDRNMATGTDSGANNTTTRTVRQALRRLRNKESIAAGVLTVTKEDDATLSWNAAVTTTAGDPLSAVDPA
jgi:hypothetical protein